MSASSQLQAALQEAIEKALDEHENSMPNRWICLIDNTDIGTGERTVWQIGSEGLKAWESLGLLHMAISLENSASYKDGEGE